MLYVVCYCFVAACTRHLYVFCVVCLVDGIAPRQYMDKQRVSAYPQLLSDGRRIEWGEGPIKIRLRLGLASVSVQSSVVLDGTSFLGGDELGLESGEGGQKETFQASTIFACVNMSTMLDRCMGAI